MVQKLGLSIAVCLKQFRLLRLLLHVDSDVLGCLGILIQTPKLQDNRVDRDRPRIQVVGYLYKSPNSSYTNLKDSAPIVIAGGLTGHGFLSHNTLRHIQQIN